MKRLTVRYFALFRESTGCDQEQLESAAATPAELFDELRARHAGLEEFEHMKFAINDELVPRNAPLSDGDVVLLFPPVAGG
jgi:molybdopterin converting factor subunit 1